MYMYVCIYVSMCVSMVCGCDIMYMCCVCVLFCVACVTARVHQWVRVNVHLVHLVYVLVSISRLSVKMSTLRHGEEEDAY